MKRLALIAVLLCTAGTPLWAQIALPGLPSGAGRTLEGIAGTLADSGQTLGDVSSTVRGLAKARLDRLERLTRANRAIIERDASGDPARRGELLMLDPSPADLASAEAAGFAVLSREDLGELGLVTIRLAVPSGMSLAKAQRLLAAQVPGATISADTLSFPGGAAASPGGAATATGGAMPAIETPVGMIDGAPGTSLAVNEARGFARGAPAASDHGSAVASLLRHAGVQRIYVADVYGKDPAGGNALALAKGLDWLVGKGVRVVSVSLVGPANPLVSRAVAAAQRKGVVIVAAVGNDGPAAPPAYPASYPGVIAVTAVDGRNRALIEAGRALHLDYAAPGADIYASNASGRRVKVRGTSFATPLVAARAALKTGGDLIAKLDAEAIDLGPRGPDRSFGRGVLCTTCRPTR